MLQAVLHPNNECWVGHVPTPSDKGLVNPPKNHKGDRGKKGITSHGRRIVRQGAHLLGEWCGDLEVSFFTGSLPGESIQDAEIACSKWDEIVRRFLQEVRRDQHRVGLPDLSVGCTEIQPKRYRDTGQPWPHLHLCFVSGNGKQWLIHRDRVKLIWRRAVSNVLGIPLDDIPDTARIDPVHDTNGLGAYLGKYMSKGGDDLAQIWEVLPGFPLPQAWHHGSHLMKEAIKNATHKLSAHSAAWLAKLAQTEGSGFKVWAIIEPPPRPDTGYTAPIGFYGILSDTLAQLILKLEGDSS